MTINGNESSALGPLTMHWSLLAMVLIPASSTGRSRTRGATTGAKGASRGFGEVTGYVGSELTYPSPAAVLPQQGNSNPLPISILLLISQLRGSSWGRAESWQVHWQLKASSSAVVPGVEQPQPAKTQDRAGYPTGQEMFGAVESWVDGAEGHIVQEEGDSASPKCFGSIETKT